MAENLVPSPTEVAPAVASDARRRRRGRGVYRARFLLAYLLLASVVGAGAAGLVLVLDRPAERAERAWSPWRPNGDDESAYPAQIARHVAGKYRLRSGKPLVNVIAKLPQLQIQGQDIPIGYVLVEGSDELLATNRTFMYVLCGRGQSCSIDEGRPSRQRLRTLKREALELTLYTFKYVDPVDSVLALLPSARDGTPTGALFYQEEDLAGELERPLDATLPRPETRKTVRVGISEAAKVERLTRPYLFSYQVQQAPDGSAVFVLAATPPGR